jgi:two-component system alkaline phosphatase synthesis response regulator PhoP
MNSKRVLCIDDDYRLLSLLSSVLNGNGFEVFTSENPLNAEKMVKEVNPNIIILDMNMPQRSGDQVFRALRDDSENDHRSILFLSANSEEDQQVSGLNLGADDYLTKPFSANKLVAKIESILRFQERIQEKKPENILKYKKIIINKDKHQVFIDGNEIEFLAKEFALLYFLVSQPNTVFSREQILARVWKENIMFTKRTIDVHITKIRQKLGKYSKNIQTVRSVGYKFLNSL